MAIDMFSFLGLEATDSPFRWSLPVAPGICGRRSVLYGSCALAAAIEVAERCTDRPTAWAACQFLRPAELGSVVELTVEVVSAGRSFSHGRVVATAAGTELFAVMIALGAGSYPEERTWPRMPVVPPPEACEERALGSDSAGRFRTRIQERWVTDRPTDGGSVDGGSADGRLVEGRAALWMRLPDGVPAAASALAALGDTVAVGTAAALDHDVQVPSIDNTIRVVRPAACEWVLSDIEIHGVGRGLAHGTVNLWSPEGDLLAVTGQTGVVRARPG